MPGDINEERLDNPPQGEGEIPHTKGPSMKGCLACRGPKGMNPKQESQCQDSGEPHVIWRLTQPTDTASQREDAQTHPPRKAREICDHVRRPVRLAIGHAGA